MFCCELLRGEVAEARMGTFAIVGDAPAFDLAPGVVERKEDVLVEALFLQTGIETLDVVFWIGRPAR
jgi:F0F1-type ATP synthase alpha subunit